MKSRTRDERLEKIRHRIDRVEKGAQAARGEAKESIKRHLDALRRMEASARDALNEWELEDSERADATEDKLRQLENRLKIAEKSLAARFAKTSSSRTGVS